MTYREEVIEAAEKALITNWRKDYRAIAAAVVDSVIAKLKGPSEEMLAAGASMTDDGEHGRQRAKGVLWAALTTLEKTHDPE